jgi:hypothetical protein
MQPLRDVSYSAEALTTSDSAACTAACTGFAKTANKTQFKAGSDAADSVTAPLGHQAVAEPDLGTVIEAWAALPDHVRAAILTLVRANSLKRHPDPAAASDDQAGG